MFRNDGEEVNLPLVEDTYYGLAGMSKKNPRQE